MSLRFIAPLIAAIAILAPTLASAEPLAQPLAPGGGSPLALTALLAGMALLPFALILVTSFVKVAVVLSILRTAIGAQQVPPNTVITGLAILLSIYIMAPVGHDIFTELRPHVDAYEAGELQVNFSSLEEASQAGAAPLRAFLMRHADPEDRLLLHELAIELRPPEQHKNVAAEDLLVVVPAFVITELKEAFTIGFILFVPFIIVDLVVANILLSLGMHMLSPTTVSLPFKLLLFVLVDGWYLVVKGLILGYV